MGDLAQLLGATIGGFIMCNVFGWIVEKFAFRDLPPNQRATYTMVWAWAACAIIAGFGFSDGGGFAWFAGLWYAPGALIAWFFWRRRLLKAWASEEEVGAFE